MIKYTYKDFLELRLGNMNVTLKFMNETVEKNDVNREMLSKLQTQGKYLEKEIHEFNEKIDEVVSYELERQVDEWDKDDCDCEECGGKHSCD